MNAHAEKRQVNKSRSVTNEFPQKQSGGDSTFQFVDNRPEAIAQRKVQELANNSPRVKQSMAFQEMAKNSHQAKQAAQFQVMANNSTAQHLESIQKKQNRMGLPDDLKSNGIQLRHFKYKIIYILRTPSLHYTICSL